MSELEIKKTIKTDCLFKYSWTSRTAEVCISASLILLNWLEFQTQVCSTMHPAVRVIKSLGLHVKNTKHAFALRVFVFLRCVCRFRRVKLHSVTPHAKGLFWGKSFTHANTVLKLALLFRSFLPPLPLWFQLGKWSAEWYGKCPGNKKELVRHSTATRTFRNVLSLCKQTQTRRQFKCSMDCLGFLKICATSYPRTLFIRN